MTKINRILARLNAADPDVQPEELLFRFDSDGSIKGAHLIAKVRGKVDPSDSDEIPTWRTVGPFTIPLDTDFPAGSPVRKLLKLVDIASVQRVNDLELESTQLKARIDHQDEEIARLITERNSQVESLDINPK